MKYSLIIFLALFAGCAHVSDYKEGCKDTLYNMSLVAKLPANQKRFDEYCTKLDDRRRYESRDNAHEKQ
jgi:hypothetical protein